MKTIIDEIAEHCKVYKGTGVSDEVIASAEQRLGLTFPSQYKDYLKECGILSFASHEITGLGISGYLNVVEATEAERKLGGTFPEDCVLIENIGVDGILVIMDAEGCVFSYQNGRKNAVAKSFFDYVKGLIR
ncbi:MAG: SMI1/KNR4 family protein [Kiritimatiellae bacterium]|nr:SMI1/KNR4 family protein [Kiritimatiellia bacterium]